jgi:hypothetical protein
MAEPAVPAVPAEPAEPAAPAVPAEPLLLPIGQFGGATGLAGDPGTRFRLRVGGHEVALTLDRFLAWAQAHGTADQTGAVPVTRPVVVAALGGGSTVDGTVAGLLADGYLASATDPVDLSRRYRLVPLLVGLGNSAAEPGRYELGLPGRPMVEVPRPVCAIWERSDRMPDLWSACLAFATAEELAPDEVAGAFVASLHGLLAVNAGYLDAAG